MALERRVEALDGWYARLAQQLDRPRGLPPANLSPPTLGPDTVVHEGSGSHYTVWLCEHLDHLAEHLDELIARRRCGSPSCAPRRGGADPTAAELAP